MVKFVKVEDGSYLNVDHVSRFKIWHTEDYAQVEIIDDSGDEWVLEKEFSSRDEAQIWLDNFIEELEF